jgi:hypothetical protein
VRFARKYGPHNEDCVAGWVEEVEGSRSPVFVLRLSKNGYLCTPFSIIGVGIIDLKRNTGISPVTIHGTVKSQLDRSALKAKKPRSAIIGSLKPHSEAKPVYIEGLCSRQIRRRENWYRLLHEPDYCKQI